MVFDICDTVEFEDTDIILAALQRLRRSKLDSTAVNFFAST